MFEVLKDDLSESCCSGWMLVTHSSCVTSTGTIKLSQKSKTFSSDALNAKAAIHVLCVMVYPFKDYDSMMTYLVGQKWWIIWGMKGKSVYLETTGRLDKKFFGNKPEGQPAMEGHLFLLFCSFLLLSH